MLRGDHPLLTQRLASPTSKILLRSYYVHDMVSDTSQLGAPLPPGPPRALSWQEKQNPHRCLGLCRTLPTQPLSPCWPVPPTCSQDQASSTHYTWMRLGACDDVIGA